MLDLNPTKAGIFRIVHVENVQWIFAHGGLHCQKSSVQNPDYVNIGNESLISKRSSQPVPIPPRGTLGNYVPFYFTPHSLMMYNIMTGHGVRKRENREIVIFFSSLHRLCQFGVQFVFTNQHACSIDVEFFSDTDDLSQIDWELLRRRDFKTGDMDPGKQVRYQAEALAYDHVPLSAIQGVACYDDNIKRRLELQLKDGGIDLSIQAIPKLYF